MLKLWTIHVTKIEHQPQARKTVETRIATIDARLLSDHVELYVSGGNPSINYCSALNFQ
jgi:uncharacterized protein YgbK (DUF1537 family)